MIEPAAFITAIVALVTCLGGGIKFVWSKIEKRFEIIEADLANCHKQHAISLDRRARQLTVIELLWAELVRISPQANVLTRAKHLLDDLKPEHGDGE